MSDTNLKSAFYDRAFHHSFTVSHIKNRTSKHILFLAIRLLHRH